MADDEEPNKGGNEGVRLYDKKLMIKALINAGTKSGAAKLMGCDRHTITNYMDEDPEIAAAVLEAKEILVDLAEMGLMANVKDKQQSAINFVLSTLGKDRGYVKRVENTGKGGGAIESEITVKTNNQKLHDIIDQLGSQVEKEKEK